MTTYDAYYFIRKFAAIPEEAWCVGSFWDHLDRRCALGHMSCTEEGTSGISACLGGSVAMAEINDGKHPRYQQSTPKRRILAALRDVVCAQLREDEE